MKTYHPTPLRLALLVAAGALIPGVAQAQNKALEEIVITATKRETGLQDTPIAVSAFGEESLRVNHVNSLLDLQGMVPNLHIAQNGDHATPLVYIRGIGSDNQTEAGDPSVAMHVDGIYSARSQAAAVMAFDLERAEILRGPQGTLFGRNSTGGVINYITAKPKQEFEARVGATYGSFNRQAVEGMVNLPVNDDWAVRFAGSRDYQDGPVKFAPGSISTDEEDQYNAWRVSGLRASSLYNIADNARWTLSYEEFRDRGTGYQPVTDYDDELLLDTLGTLALDTKSLRSRIDWELTDDLSLAYIAGQTKMTQEQDWDGDRSGGIGSVTDPLVYHQTNQTVWSRHEALQHEIQLKNGDENSFRWILGYFNFEEVNGIRFDMEHQDSTGSGWGGGPSHSFLQPNRGLDSEAIFVQTSFDVTDALTLTAGVRSGRDTRYDRGGRNIACPDLIRADRGGVVGPVAVNQASAAPGQCFVIAYNDVEQSWTSTTPMLRAEFQMSDDVLLYVSYAEGFKPGVIQDGGGLPGTVYSGEFDPQFLTDLQQLIATNNSSDPGSRAYVEPEDNQNFELGAKMELLDGRMTLNSALFFTNYENLQVSGVVETAAGAEVLRTSNAAEATVNGLEVEGRMLVGDAGLLTFSGAWLDATYDKFITVDSDFATNGETWNPGVDHPTIANLVDMSGNRLKQAPEFQFMLGYEHVFELNNDMELTPRIRMTYVDDIYFNEANRGDRPALLVDNATDTLVPAANGAASDIDRQAAYVKLDASVRLVSMEQKLTTELFVNNATDEIIRNDDNGTGSATPDYYLAPPRQFGLRVMYNF